MFTEYHFYPRPILASGIVASAYVCPSVCVYVRVSRQSRTCPRDSSPTV